MDWSFCKRSKAGLILGLIPLSATALALGLGSSNALAAACVGNPPAPDCEQKQMVRKAHLDMQGRQAYQPNVIQYPDGRWIFFSGLHSGTHPNPLKGGVVEANGTMIIDVTNVNAPVEKSHIPATDGQSQMVRMCLARDLPSGSVNPTNAAADRFKVYMMRNTGSRYETWDVTNVSAPFKLAEITGLNGTHKHWWECSSGLVYAPGSRLVDTFRQDQSMLVMDWKNPKGAPNLIRTFTLAGGQSAPVGTGPVPPSLHGAVSAAEHPDRFNPLVHGAGVTDVVGNRIYAAWGVGSDGILQIIDRQKLLPPASSGLGAQTGIFPYGGTWDGTGSGKIPELGAASIPTNAQLLIPQAGQLIMSPDQGGHSSIPVFGMEPPSYQSYGVGGRRDIVLLSSEATSNLCNQTPKWTFTVDVSTENSIGVAQDPWQGPMVLATMATDPRSGNAFPRGDYCTRGARFGTHSTEENFNHPYYGRCTFIAIFTGGVRAWDFREPQAPKEIAFFVPGINAFTPASGYMTNNVELDARGNIYIVDRSGGGMDIIQLTGAAKTACSF